MGIGFKKSVRELAAVCVQDEKSRLTIVAVCVQDEENWALETGNDHHSGRSAKTFLGKRHDKLAA